MCARNWRAKPHMASRQHSSARELSAHPLLWRGKQLSHSIQAINTGFTRLDENLPGQGWPRGAVTELIHEASGCGEFSLLLPALARLSRRKHRIVMIDPPWIPYPSALYGHGLLLEKLLLVRTQSRQERLWACEQVVRGMPGGAMLAWPGEIAFSELRRLQLAAKNSRQSVFLFRGPGAANIPSPSELRLQLNSDDGDLEIRILKCRGQRPSNAIRIPQTEWGQRTIFSQNTALPRQTPTRVGGIIAQPQKELIHHATFFSNRSFIR